MPQFFQAKYHNFSKQNATIFPNYLHKSIIISTFAADLKNDKDMRYFKRISDELLHQRLQVGLRRKDGVYVIPIGCLKD